MQLFTKPQLLDIVKKTISSRFGGTKLVLEALLTQNFLPIGSRLAIYKHPSNSNMDALEVNDMVQGWATDVKFVTARYTGGDTTEWANFNIINEINNIEID